MKICLFIWFMLSVVVAFAQTEKKHDIIKLENFENDELSKIRKVERNGIDSIKLPVFNFKEFEKKVYQTNSPVLFMEKKEEEKIEMNNIPNNIEINKNENNEVK